ncbi:6513_t:CDS:2 [Paraglomus occultum]|uniref:6513_t:CDS:1 n=1 Tax=Paraglomus occultum TaxID=144539 RepID=A0A9N9C2S5_9GLOM|nr:6513_t:CDS:2 [Paraglomus occultum]
MINKTSNVKPERQALIEDGRPPTRHEGKGSNVIAYMHLVCVVAGSGTLGMSYAISQGGWVSVSLLILAGIMSAYSNNKLIESLYYNSQTRRSSLSHIAQDAFGKAGTYFVSFLYVVIQFGCPILYLILSSDNLKILLTKTGIDISVNSWILICGITICVPFVFIKNLKEGAWLRQDFEKDNSIMVISNKGYLNKNFAVGDTLFFGALSTALVVFVVCIISLMEYPHNRSNEHDFVNIRNIPIAMATFNFGYGGNVIYPNIEAGYVGVWRTSDEKCWREVGGGSVFGVGVMRMFGSMRTPASWPRVNALAMITVTAFYLLIGIPGYLTYGHSTHSPIYNNLPAGISVTLSIAMITIHVLLALPIYLTSFALDIEKLFKIDKSVIGARNEFAYRVLLRVLLMSFVIWVAVSVPFFADWMSFLGAMANGLLIIVVPVVIWVKLVGWEQVKLGERLWIVASLGISIVGACVGTWDAVVALWKDIANG